MSTSESRRSFSLNGLDVAAIACAVMLSLGCLVKGAVYDTTIAIGMVVAMPILVLACVHARSVHRGVMMAGAAVFLMVVAMLLLQKIIPSSDVIDHAAWMRGVGRLLFLMMVFGMALLIGSAESSARLFFLALLISGTIAVTVTFFVATENGVPTTTHYSYRHGFVNANNAAAYLGVMLLLGLAQAARFFRNPANSIQKNVMNIIDRLSMMGIIKGVSLLFCLLLALAGLFMTGSRGGIFMALLTASVFCFMVIHRMQLARHLRYSIVSVIILIAGSICIWSFLNFGQVISNKIETNGVSANSRPDIFAAVMPMIADHPLLGTGLGSFPGAFQKYRPQNVSSDGIIDKAHNSYLEFAAEMGLPAFMVLLAALGWMGWQLYRGVKERHERYVTPAFGVSVWLLGALYSLIDFPLQIPGLAALFLAIIVVCVSQSDRRFCQPAPSVSNAPSKRVRIRKRRTTNVKPL